MQPNHLAGGGLEVGWNVEHGRRHHRSWGVMRPPLFFYNFSVFTVLNPHLPMHGPPTFKCVVPPLLSSTYIHKFCRFVEVGCAVEYLYQQVL